MDKNMEKRVWQRVYRQSPYRQTPRQRQELQRSLNRARSNRRYFESRRNDPVYGEAFAYLAEQALEHCKMLERILEG